MAKTKKYSKKLGQIPGSIIYTGEKSNRKLFIEAFGYNSNNCVEKDLSDVEEALEFINSESITWINLNGLNHVKDIEKLGNLFNLHPLVLEDIVNISQRPKIDEYADYLFVVLKMLYKDKNANIISEQVSFILGKNYVLSFQEAEGDVFENVRNRIRNSKGRIRGLGSDYLLYSLIDAVTDHYFIVIENIGEKIEALEDNLFNDQSKDEISQQIQDLKREILKFRRAIFPLREIINRIEKNDNSLILDNTLEYFRDVYDHIIQVTENIDIYREMILGLRDMHMTSISNKMNEVMKVLTIIATIFIPLTFIAGIYGMNFDNIPELHYKYGYFILWGIMIALFITMLLYFKRKKWL